MKTSQSIACFQNSTPSPLKEKFPNADECTGRFLGIISQDTSVSKSNWLHVDTFCSSFLYIT